MSKILGRLFLAFFIVSVGVAFAQSPSGLNANCSPDGTSVTVSWNPVANAQAYAPRVNNPTNDADASCYYGFCSTGGDWYDDWYGSTSKTVTNIVPGQTYGFWVHSYVNGAYSDPPSSAPFTCQPAAAPAPLVAPTGLNAQCSPSGSEVTLSWNAMAGANAYATRLNNPSNDSGACPHGWNCGSGGDWLDDNYTSTSKVASIVPNQGYSFWIHSVQNGVNSPASSVSFTCTPPQAPPPPPSAVNAVCDAAGTQATISWSAAPGATFYYPRLNDPTNDQPGCLGGWYCEGSQDWLHQDYRATSYTTSVTSGRQYSFWVHSANGAGYSAPISTNVVCAAPLPPPKPTGLVVTCAPEAPSEVQRYKMTFKWDPVAGASAYMPRLNDPRNDYGPGCNAWICPNSADWFDQNYSPTEYTVRNVLPGTQYDFWVHSKFGSAYSDYAVKSHSCTAGEGIFFPVAICNLGDGTSVIADKGGFFGAGSAVQQCLSEGTLTTNRILNIPAGIYKLDRPLAFTRPLTLQTLGTEISSAPCSRDESGDSCAVFKAANDLVVPQNGSPHAMMDALVGLKSLKLDRVVLDGNGSVRRPNAIYCDGAAGATAGVNILLDYVTDFEVTRSVFRDAVCGSGMVLNHGQGVKIVGNQFFSNGAHAQTQERSFWADGLTLLECAGCRVAFNTFADNTDVAFVYGGGISSTIEKNTIEQISKRVFAGIALTNFAGSRSGDFSNTKVTENTVSCGGLCTFGISLGEHSWYPSAPLIYGGEVSKNTVSGATIGIHAIGAGGLRQRSGMPAEYLPISIFSNTVDSFLPAVAIPRTVEFWCNGNKNVLVPKQVSS